MVNKLLEEFTAGIKRNVSALQAQERSLRAKQKSYDDFAKLLLDEIKRKGRR